MELDRRKEKRVNKLKNHKKRKKKRNKKRKMKISLDLLRISKNLNKLKVKTTMPPKAKKERVKNRRLLLV